MRKAPMPVYTIVSLRLQTDSVKAPMGWLGRIEAFLNERWYGKAGVLHLLHPLSWLYAAVASFRRRRAEAQIERVVADRLPTIVVGNLVVGGTGKTPVVAELVKELKALGAQPGIVTRGYGGSSPSWPLSVVGNTDPRLCGDEALELAQIAGCPVVAGPDRRACVQQLASMHGCDVAVSDDGLQHYSMQRDLEIVLVGSRRQFGNGYLLPVGPLREPTSRIRQAQIVFLTSRSLEQAEASKSGLQHLVGQLPSLLACALVPSEARQLLADKSMELSKAPFVNEPCIALSGIGMPERFHEDLESLGCTIDPRALADHHDYAELVGSGALSRLASQSWVVTTGKDAVKLEFQLGRTGRAQASASYDRVWVLKRRVVFSEADLSELRRVLRKFARDWQLGDQYGDKCGDKCKEVS